MSRQRHERESRVLGFCGPKGIGKSQRAFLSLMQLSPMLDFALVSDWHGDAPSKLYDGTRVPLRKVDSLDRVEFEIARRRMESKFVRSETPIYSFHPSKASPTRLLEFGRRHARKDRHVAVLIDEAGLWDQANNLQEIGARLGDYLASARHTGLWLLWCCQFPSQIHWSIIRQTDVMVLFRMSDQMDLNRLKRGGIGDDHRAIVQTLPDVEALQRRPDLARYHIVKMVNPDIAPIVLA